MSTTQRSKVRRVDTLSTEAKRGHVVDEVQVILSDGRAPRVLIWYFPPKDGFTASIDYEIWNESGTRIVQEARTIDNGEGFDYDLIALDCDDARIVDGALIEAEYKANSRGYYPDEPEHTDNSKDHLPW